MMATVPAQATIGLLDPLIQTPVAVFELLSAAHANTLIFSVFACLAALELFRSSTGLVLYFARFAFAITVLAIIATVQYGDFLAAPAKAALSIIMANQPPEGQQTAFITTLSLVTAGAAYHAGKANVRASRAPYRSTPHQARASAQRGVKAGDKPGRLVDLSLADRLLVRKMNTSRPIEAARTPKRMQTYQAARNWS
jgi:uncharacterized SAM-binding protein YcdF (DUF218 family)